MITTCCQESGVNLASLPQNSVLRCAHPSRDQVSQQSAHMVSRPRTQACGLWGGQLPSDAASGASASRTLDAGNRSLRKKWWRAAEQAHPQLLPAPPDLRSEVSMAEKPSNGFLGFPAHRQVLLHCPVVYRLKNKVHTLIKICFIVKKY